MLKLILLCAARAAWEPAAAPLMTIWGVTGVPEPPAYPRPLLARAADSWRSLNGLWQYDGTPRSLDAPPFGATLPQEIMVPYPPESALSGVANLTAHDRSWYRLTRNTTALVPPSCAGGGAMRALLHFEAADWNVTVWLNGAMLGSHVGAYDPFSFDITDGANARRNAVQYITNERRNDPSSPQRSRRTGRRTSCSSACSTRPPTTRRTASRT